MENFEQLREVWLTADTAKLPEARGLLHTAKSYRMKQWLRSAGVLALVIILLATMVWVLFGYHSRLVSTRIGEAFFLAALFIMLTVQLRSLKRLSEARFYNNSEFLRFLQAE